MLKLSLTETYDVKDVPVTVGTYITGEFQKAVCHMDFRIPAGFTRAMLHEQTKTDEAAFYKQLIVGWGDDVADENGNPLPCDDKTKAAVLKNEAVVYGIMQVLTPILLGVPLAKNSVTGSTL